VNKEAVGWLSRDLANVQSELRQSQREVENARTELSAIRKAVEEKLMDLSRFRSDNVTLQVKSQSQHEAIEHLQKALDMERKLNQSLLSATKRSFKPMYDSRVSDIPVLTLFCLSVRILLTKWLWRQSNRSTFN